MPDDTLDLSHKLAVAAGVPLQVAQTNASQLPDMQKRVADAVAQLDPADVVSTVADHLGLSTDLADAKAFLAAKAKSLAEKADAAVSEADAVFHKGEAQLVVFLHSILARVAG